MPYDPMNKDTIAAIATSFGHAGIGIVRISGSGSRNIAERIFKPRKDIKNLESHRLYLGRLIDPSSGEMVDEILLSFMKAPHSYTREDVVDLINSRSEKGIILASRQIRGELRERIEGLRQKALDALARTEIAIDFPDEESAITSRKEVVSFMERELIEPIDKIIAAHARRRIWMDGIATVIAGRVNVGKSSLLNHGSYTIH